MGSALNSPAEKDHEPGSGLGPRLEPDPPPSQDAGAPWLAALTAHVAVAALLAFLAPAAFEPAQQREPETLIVTLVIPALEPPPDAPAAPADVPAEAEASEPPSAPAPRFDVATELPATRLPPPDALEVLASPDSTTAAPPLPESVRAALASLADCAASTRDDRREEPCSPVYRVAQTGPNGAAYLDERALQLRGFAAGWEQLTTNISSIVVDEHIFDGRGGQPMVGESWWSIYAKADPLAGDWRIFNPQTGEVAIEQPPTAPPAAP